ncbi:MAG: ABC transporter ATP-binding protein [Oscillospiraceae bacterium]|nr:ABC transporter ATP-binding protein [Oscillospiraceae bacterium]
MENTLEITDLRAGFPTEKGVAMAVDGVSLTIPRGGVAGLVGESGCGKSMTGRAVMGLIRQPGKIYGGSVRFEGRELTALSQRELGKLRGGEISMVFQEPMTSLNPVMTVGRQVAETLRLHRGLSRAEARAETVRMFEKVGIPDPEKRYDCYPHQLSGGLRQRAVIAMAMICRPRLLIADEPTTALDVTVEAQILRLLRALTEKQGTSVLLISHDLGVVAQLCDSVSVMYAGQIVEQAPVCALFDRPAHPYTRGLLGAVQSLRAGDAVLDTIPGGVPDFLRLPPGCRFAPRCGQACPGCAEVRPPLRELMPGHFARCVETGGGV